jgi:hypothetical protein
MEIKASVGMVFEEVFGEFLLEVSHTRRKVQQPVERTEIEVLISARPYSCMDCGRIF